MFVTVLLVFVLLNGYVGWHGFVLLESIGAAPSAFWYGIVFAIVAISYLLGRIPGLGPVGRLLKVIGSYYFAVFEFSVLLLPAADLAAWVLHLGGVSSSVYVPVLGSITLVVLLVLLLRGSWNAWTPIVRKYEIEIDKPGPQETIRLAVASDLHLGNLVGNRHLKKLVTRMNAMNPDLVLLAGDVLDDVIEPFLRNKMADTMNHLVARYGKFAVLGNHEYYGGHIEEHVKQMAGIGIQVLQDEVVPVADGALYVAGRKDKTAESTDPAGRLPTAALLADIDRSLPVIVMDHQPYEFGLTAAAGADLLLCGHTHRGQFAPNHLLTKRLFELDWGYMRKEHMHVVVSSGFGSWGPPIRLASRSEIIEVVVRFRKSSS